MWRNRPHRQGPSLLHRLDETPGLGWRLATGGRQHFGSPSLLTFGGTVETHHSAPTLTGPSPNKGGASRSLLVCAGGRRHSAVEPQHPLRPHRDGRPSTAVPLGARSRLGRLAHRLARGPPPRWTRLLGSPPRSNHHSPASGRAGSPPRSRSTRPAGETGSTRPARRSTMAPMTGQSPALTDPSATDRREGRSGWPERLPLGPSSPCRSPDLSCAGATGRTPRSARGVGGRR